MEEARGVLVAREAGHVAHDREEDGRRQHEQRCLDLGWKRQILDFGPAGGELLRPR